MTWDLAAGEEDLGAPSHAAGMLPGSSLPGVTSWTNILSAGSPPVTRLLGQGVNGRVWAADGERDPATYCRGTSKEMKFSAERENTQNEGLFLSLQWEPVRAPG